MTYFVQFCMTASDFYIQMYVISNMYIITDKRNTFKFFCSLHFLCDHVAIYVQIYSTTDFFI